jgi:hypothetical protein
MPHNSRGYSTVSTTAMAVVFLGYIKELVATANAQSPPLHPQPLEYQCHEAALREGFKDILQDDIPPGLPRVGQLKDGQVLEHTIPLKPGATPEARQPYRFSKTELAKVRARITTPVNQGWIRLSLGSWGAPVLFQRKKDGKLRMSVDYSALSNHTVKHANPMPHIEGLLHKLLACKVVSKLDLKSGYHQIRMAREDNQDNVRNAIRSFRVPGHAPRPLPTPLPPSD